MRTNSRLLIKLLITVAVLLLAAISCFAQVVNLRTQVSRDIRVLSAVGMREVVKELGAEFERSTGHKLKVTYDSGAVLEKAIMNGHVADVVLLPRPVIDRLSRAGRLQQGSVADIASSVIGVAVRKGSLKPDISSSEAFKRAILNARSIACPDPALGGSSGVHISRIFERLGIASAVKPKLVLVSTPELEESMPGHQVANGRAEIALHQMQELMAVPGIEIVGPLPNELQAQFVFSGAVMVNAKNAAASRSFIDFLRSAGAKAAINSLGMKPAMR